MDRFASLSECPAVVGALMRCSFDIMNSHHAWYPFERMLQNDVQSVNNCSDLRVPLIRAQLDILSAVKKKRNPMILTTLRFIPPRCVTLTGTP